MKYFLSIILSISLISCGSNEKEIKLFNGVSVQVYKNENVSSPLKEKIDEYNVFYELESFAIPLFKYIKGQSYELFIGVPYQISIEQYKTLQENIDRKESSIAEDDTYFYRSYKFNEDYLAEMFVLLPKGSIYMRARSENKEVFQSLFGSDKFLDRVLVKKSR